jgi:hypothetical protein
MVGSRVRARVRVMVMAMAMVIHSKIKFRHQFIESVAL